MAKTVIQLDSIRNKVHTKAVADILPCQLVPLQLIQKSSCLHVITIDIKLLCKIKNFLSLFCFFPPGKQNAIHDRYLNLVLVNGVSVCCVKGAMLRIARLLSHYLFGAKKFARASKNPSYQACKSWPSSSFSFPTKIWHQIVMKLTSSSSQLSSQQQGANTKTTNYLISFSYIKLSFPHRFSLISRIPNPKSKSTLSLVTEQIVVSLFY